MNDPTRFDFQVLAEPGTQSICRIVGIAALYDPGIVSGSIEIRPNGAMWVQLRLNFPEPAAAALLLARLKNLVDVRKARMLPAIS